MIENGVAWLTKARAVATRYEKLAIHYLSVLKLSMSRMLRRRFGKPLSDKP